jgi:hypothetical protein
MEGNKTMRDMVNAHLPILLQLISTVSLVVIAVSAIGINSSLQENSSKGAVPIEVSPSD